MQGEERELVGKLLCYEGGLDVGRLGEQDGVFEEGGEDAGGLGRVFFIISCQ